MITESYSEKFYILLLTRYIFVKEDISLTRLWEVPYLTAITNTVFRQARKVQTVCLFGLLFVGQLLSDLWLAIASVVASCCLICGQLLPHYVSMRLSCGQLLAHFWPAVGSLVASCWLTCGQLLAYLWPAARVTSPVKQLPLWRHQLSSCPWDITSWAAVLVTSPAKQLSLRHHQLRSCSCDITSSAAAPHSRRNYRSAPLAETCPARTAGQWRSLSGTAAHWGRPWTSWNKLWIMSRDLETSLLLVNPFTLSRS